MKNIFESAEIFEAYARIDFCYFGIMRLQKELASPISPIIRAVDITTGYGDVRSKKIKAECEMLLLEVIASKRLIEADTTGDENFLQQLREMNSEPAAQESDTTKAT